MKKRLLSWLLVLTMVISLVPSTLITTAFAAPAAGGGVDISNPHPVQSETTTIDQPGTYQISGTRRNPVKITATDEVVLVLNNVTITTATSPIELAAGAQVTLVVPDGTSNTLTCNATTADDSNGGRTAGILVPETASLTIDKQENGKGNGELTVTAAVGGAGIGGGAGIYSDARAGSGADGTAGTSSDTLRLIAGSGMSVKRWKPESSCLWTSCWRMMFLSNRWAWIWFPAPRTPLWSRRKAVKLRCSSKS